MVTTEPLAELAASAQALFAQKLGAFHPDDFIAVAGLLGFRASLRSPSPVTPRPTARNYFPDLVGTNLRHALQTYDWGTWRPLSADGVTISGFRDSAQTSQPPASFCMAEDGRTLQRQYGQRSA